MSCIYTYQNQTFKTKADLNTFIDSEKVKVKDMFKDYQAKTYAAGNSPTMDGFKEYFKSREGLPQFKAVNRLFTVQEGNLASIKDGTKTLSFRTVKDGKLIRVGDNLDIQSKGRSANIRVQVTAVHPIEKFPNVSKKEKDRMARMLGNYKDFEDMLQVNDYLNPRSTASKNFREYSQFLRGEGPGVFIEYELIERSAEDIIEDALTSNPALNPYQNLLEEVITEVGKQIESLERSDVKNKSFKENRLTRLREIQDNAVASKDLLVLSADAIEDLRVNESALDNLLAKDDLDDDALLSRLFSFRRLVESYSFLDNIEREIDIVIKGSTDATIEPTKAFKELQDAVTVKKNIQNKYLKAIEGPIARKLVPFRADNAFNQIKEEFDEVLTKNRKIIADAKKNDKISDEKRKRIIDKANKRIDKKERALARSGYDEKSIIALMQSVEKDIDFFEKWLGAPEQSSDPITAQFSIAVKREMEHARRRTIDVANDIQEVYDRFQEEHAGFSLEKMYGDMLETYSSYTETRGEERVRFVSKFDDALFAEKRKEHLDSLDFKAERVKLAKELQEIETRKKLKSRKKGDASRARKITSILEDPLNKDLKDYLSLQWYLDNTQEVSDEKVKEVIKKKLADLGLPLTVEWAEDNMNTAAMHKFGLLPNPTEDQLNQIEFSMGPFLKNELRTPTNDYINAKWSAMYDLDGKPTNLKGELHKVLTDKYLEAQKKIPEHRRQGLILPGIYKATKDRVIEGQGVVNTIKNLYQEAKENYTGDNLAEDIEFGNSDSLGNMVANIPTYFYNSLEPKDTSIDVVQSVMQYVKMADVYTARANSLETSMFLIDKISRRKVGKQNSYLRNSYDNAARKFGFKRQLVKDATDDNSAERMRKFVEMVVFGESNLKWQVGNVRMDKVLQTFMQYASFSSFALPVDAGSKLFMGATANLNQQIAQQFIEAASGDSGLTPKVIAKGQKLFTKYGHDILLKDFGKSGNKTLVGQLIDRYDVIQGEFVDTIGNKVSGSKARKLFHTDSLFFHRHLSEYEPQVALFLGIMDSTKVKQGDKEISLMEAYELGSDGRMKLKDGVKWSADEEFKLMTRLHGLNKTFNGVYNSFSKPVLEQHVLGKVLAFFRKYLYPSLRRRWSGERIDYEQDKFERGYALSFWRALHRDFTAHGIKTTEILKGESFTKKEKQEAIKTMVSGSIWLGNMGLAMIIRMLIESTDDDDDVMLNYLLYNAVRMQSETASFWNPHEFLRILRSPTILTTYLERVTKFTTQLMFDPTAEYKRATGSNDKGDSKLYSRFVKMLLGQTSYSTSPETAVKNFENLIN